METAYFPGIGFPKLGTPSANPKMIIAHSYGLHTVPRPLLQGAKCLVVISGFLSFHSKLFSADLVENMAIQMSRDPRSVLAKFYKRCGLTTMLPDVETEGLPKKLRELNRSSYDPVDLPTLILHGDQDKIVPLEKAYELQSNIAHSQLRVIRGGGHALPMTHHPICMDYATEFFEAVNS